MISGKKSFLKVIAIPNYETFRLYVFFTAKKTFEVPSTLKSSQEEYSKGGERKANCA